MLGGAMRSPSSSEAATMSSLVCRNVRIGGRRTSIKLEASMWLALEDICERTERGLNDICTEVAGRERMGTFTSAMRVHILDFYRRAERGQRTAKLGAPGEAESFSGRWRDHAS